jgi:hypothetical protein
VVRCAGLFVAGYRSKTSLALHRVPIQAGLAPGGNPSKRFDARAASCSAYAGFLMGRAMPTSDKTILDHVTAFLLRFAISFQETVMKKLIMVAACTLLIGNFAVAAESCDAQAAAKNLSGAARTSFTKKCESDAKASSASTCDDQAATRKLAGAAKTSFLKKCNADAKATGTAATCETQAAEKKLAGAAKSSFMKKCVADTKG